MPPKTTPPPETHGTSVPDPSNNLDAWLARIEQLHPHEIELGLARTRAVQARLGLVSLPFVVISVAGTNGKGSVVALLEAILRAAGYCVGAYSSPHLVDYNERIRIDGEALDDAVIVDSFERIETARGDTVLTYFEFGTLAAVDCFVRAGVDVALLEVGLGGRLDAVNVFDPDVAVVTSIALDHMAWLGADREDIGAEKAGIFRPRRPAICGDVDPPASVAAYAREIGANYLQAGNDFSFGASGDGFRWQGPTHAIAGLPRPALAGAHQLGNAATALMALDVLAARLPVTPQAIREGLAQIQLAGRMQQLYESPEVLLDVAHNPAAMRSLVATLIAQPVAGLTHVVIGMMADKEIRACLAILAALADRWYMADLAPPRGASAATLAESLPDSVAREHISRHGDIMSAYTLAQRGAATDDRILVLGSFESVGVILRHLSCDESDPGEPKARP